MKWEIPRKRDNRSVHRASYLLLEQLLVTHVREAQIAADTGDFNRLQQHHQEAQNLLDSLREAQTEVSQRHCLCRAYPNSVIPPNGKGSN